MFFLPCALFSYYGMKTLEKISKAALVAELQDASKEIAAIYCKARKMLRSLENVVQDTWKEWQRLDEVAQSLKYSDHEQLSPDDLLFVESKLFASELESVWENALREQCILEELYSTAKKIRQQIEKLRKDASEMYQNYPEDE